ncbi:MAG: hypothetical protein ABI954_15520, partial [Pyrinomonadaceae bacterium]
MAVPSTAFKDLLWKEKTPAEMYEMLKREGYLSVVGLRESEKVISIISKILKTWEEKDSNKALSQIPGGGAMDDVAYTLIRNNYINAKGQRLNQPRINESLPSNTK